MGTFPWSDNDVTGTGTVPAIDNGRWTMRNSLGISAGAAGVCGALVTSDDSGKDVVEYRLISADGGIHSGLGDLALSAIGLMTVQVPDRRIEPDAIAIAYRTDSQAASVRSAARRQRRPIRLVPETVATLAYLRSTGLVTRYASVALADLGASGLTVTVLDPADGSIEVRERTTAVSGDAAADEPAGRIASRVADFVADVAGRAPTRPEAVVLVGGGGNIADVGATLEAEFDGATILVDEPEAATAKGAALLARSSTRQEFPVVAGSGGRVSAVVLGAFAVAALVLGYGVKEMLPSSDENYAPTGGLVETIPSTPDTPSVPDDPTPSTVNREDTGIPSADPTVTSVRPRPAPAPTEPTPAVTAPPTSTTTTPTAPEVPPTTTPTPLTTTPETPTTQPTTPTTTPPTTSPLPWIPPMWPELPTWSPEVAPQRPESGSAVSPESGSPTPTAPDSSPR